MSPRLLLWCVCVLIGLSVFVFAQECSPNGDCNTNLTQQHKGTERHEWAPEGKSLSSNPKKSLVPFNMLLQNSLPPPVFQPTPLSIEDPPDEPKYRKFSNAAEGHRTKTPTKNKFEDLSDVTIADDEEDAEFASTEIKPATIKNINNVSEKKCSHQNKTYDAGEIFYKGCSETCTCGTNGNASCIPRCHTLNNTIDRCVEIPDPDDSCCKKLVCDVTLEDNEPEKHHAKVKIISAKRLNSSYVLITFDTKLNDKEPAPIVEVSNNKKDWTAYQLLPEGLLPLESKIKYIKLDGTDDVMVVADPQSPQEESMSRNSNKDLLISATSSTTISSDPPSIANVSSDADGTTCTYKSKTFKLNEEYNDNCTSLCVCKRSGMKCLKLECPTFFGTDVLDPNCVEWDTVPSNFTPIAPNCCPEKLECKSNGSCEHEGVTYQNWQQLPSNVTGCEKRCYCEMGKIECQNACAPLTALPPNDLHCPVHMAVVDHIPGDDCCMQWSCKIPQPGQGGQNFAPGFPINPAFQIPQSQNEITVHILEALDAHTIRLAFLVPPVIVGLHGRVEVRYTDLKTDDLSAWELQIFAPPNDLIATPQLEFDLLGLKPNTEYKIKITITLMDLHNTPTSRVYKIKTLPEIPTTTIPPMIPIEPDLTITDVNSTWVTAAWRKFTDFELQFIDGVQLRYKEIDGKIYAATPLIHRLVNSFTLEDLMPNTKYEIGIFFIPFADQHTELHAAHMLHFTTATEVGVYGFNVTLNITHIKSTGIEISWSGVPYPDDKYVSVYRAIYQSDSGKEDHSTFKVAARDVPSKMSVNDLKPGTRYRIWLEIYLTNGKTKTSNVQDFLTKPRPTLLEIASEQDKLLVGQAIAGKGDYYGALVVVSILAAIAILSTLVLILILLKRHNQNKASITPPNTIGRSAYDNPSYKIDIQQETMGL